MSEILTSDAIETFNRAMQLRGPLLVGLAMSPGDCVRFKRLIDKEWNDPSILVNSARSSVLIITDHRMKSGSVDAFYDMKLWQARVKEQNEFESQSTEKVLGVANTDQSE